MIESHFRSSFFFSNITSVIKVTQIVIEVIIKVTTKSHTYIGVPATPHTVTFLDKHY